MNKPLVKRIPLQSNGVAGISGFQSFSYWDADIPTAVSFQEILLDIFDDVIRSPEGH